MSNQKLETPTLDLTEVAHALVKEAYTVFADKDPQAVFLALQMMVAKWAVDNGTDLPTVGRVLEINLPKFKKAWETLYVAVGAGGGPRSVLVDAGTSRPGSNGPKAS